MPFPQNQGHDRIFATDKQVKFNLDNFN